MQRNRVLHFVTFVLIAIVVIGFLHPGVPKALAQVADSADSLVVRLSRPISSSRDSRARLTTKSLRSTFWAEFPSNDIPKSRQNANNAQELTVLNNDATANVCYTHIARNLKLVDGGPTPDCAKLLDAGITLETCTDDAPDGGAALFVPPKGSKAESIAGDDCIFVRAMTDNADAQYDLVVR